MNLIPNYRLQNVIYPSKDLSVDWDMYFRIENKDANSLVDVFVSDEKIIFRKGGFVSFDTFFNGFTVQAWRNNTNIDKLFLKVNCKGRFLLRISQHHSVDQLAFLQEVILDSLDHLYMLEINDWRELKDGILYFSLKSLEDDSEFYSAEFVTDTKPVNDVRLGVVITHFNRKQYVVPAIRRISDELLSDDNYSSISLIVADNSRNIEDSEKYKAIVIPNKNLGGSGGFTRGLLYLEDNGYTHCLFMDDDASCEIESIRRAYHLLQFSTTEKFAVAGSMLYEDYPCNLHEKGAIFYNSNYLQLKSNLDMRLVRDLVAAEYTNNQPNYGGWWFFGFKIEEIKYYSFPFFVRGDDVLFGVSNDFNIQTLNGISCWAEHFAYKDSPMTKYLGARSTLINNFWMNTPKDYTITSLKRWFLVNLFSFNYGSAQAILCAVKDVLLGCDFWLDNMDMSTVRKNILAISVCETMKPIELANFDLDYVIVHSEKRLRKLFRLITLNGLLLPKFLQKKRVLFQKKMYDANLMETFRYTKILYYSQINNTGYYAEFNLRTFLSLLFEYTKIMRELSNQYEVIKLHYKTKMPKMMTKEFWRQVYSK